MAENRQYSKPKFQPVMQDATGKLPPRDTEMEEVVLGALMLEKDAYMNVADILTADAFYDPVNAMIYEAISTLGLNQRPIDMMSVKEQLRRDGNLEKAGGAVHITELTARVGCQCGIPRQDRGPEISGAAPDFLRLENRDGGFRREQRC